MFPSTDKTAVGTLETRDVLSTAATSIFEPDVAGHVAILFQSGRRNTSGRLFGPLQIKVTLHATARTSIEEARGDNKVTHHGKTRLLKLTQTIYDHATTVDPGQEVSIPFALRMPTATSDGKPLPPSMKVRSSSHPSFEADVDYYVSVAVSMPGIHVKIIHPKKSACPRFDYQQLSTVPMSQDWICEENFLVQNKYLLPEASRPCGLLGNTKACLRLLRPNTYPIYNFLVAFTVPDVAIIGSRLNISLAIEPMGNQAQQDIMISTIQILSCKIHLTSITNVSAPGTLTNKTATDTRKEQSLLKGAYWEGVKIPGHKSWTEEAISAPVMPLPVSFETPGISRRYVLEMKCRLLVANKKIKVGMRSEVVVVDPGT